MLFLRFLTKGLLKYRDTVFFLPDPDLWCFSDWLNGIIWQIMLTLWLFETKRSFRTVEKAHLWRYLPRGRGRRWSGCWRARQSWMKYIFRFRFKFFSLSPVYEVCARKRVDVPDTKVQRFWSVNWPRTIVTHLFCISDYVEGRIKGFRDVFFTSLYFASLVWMNLAWAPGASP